MKKLLLLFFTVVAVGLFAAQESDPSLLFYASFDSYSTDPDYAKGFKKTTTAALRDLQLRMFNGVADQKNALELSNRESVWYDAPKNIDPRKGTVMLWVAAQNWVPSDKSFQIFFNARLNGDWHLVVYKFANPGYIRTALIFKGKEYAINIPVKDIDWEKGKWHQLAVTWDSTRIAFYMDGKLAKPLKYTKNPVIFTSQQTFPGKVSQCSFSLGTAGSYFRATPDHRTAIDEVKIYNRMISADEIRREYEKFYSPQTGEADRPVASLPNGSAVTLDGKIGQDEWKDASVVPVMNLLQKEEWKYGPFTRVFMKQDAQNYYFAFEVMEKAGHSSVKSDDIVDIYRDDCVELHFFSPQTKRYYQYIVNPNGAVFDSSQTVKDTQIYSYVSGGTPEWQSNARKAAFKGEKFWSVELAIPKKSMQFGNEIWANFCRTSNGSKSAVTWAPGCQAYYHMDKFGKLIPGGKAVRLSNFEFAGGLCNVDFDGEDICIYDNNHSRLNFVNGKLELPAGVFRLESKGKNWNYVFPFYLKKDFDFSYNCYPSKKCIEVKVNLSSSSGNVRKQLAKGLPVAVTLEDINGNILTQADVNVKNIEQDINLALPENPVRGICNIRVAFADGTEKVSAIKKFRIPDMTPFINKVADDNTVPAPWSAIKSVNGRYELLNKTFTFKKGPFPASAEINGKAVFKSSPAMQLNGRNISWSVPVVKKNTGDRVIFEGTGSADGISFRYITELWFDGMVKTDIFMNGSKAVDSLKMNWKVPAEYAKYLLNPLFTKWQGKDGEKLNLPYTNGQDFMLWTMGIENGLCFHPSSQANFFLTQNSKNYTISRKGDTVSIDVDIINRKAVLKKQAQYTFVFMPTPAKPFNPKWRDINFGDMWGYQKHETFKINGFGVTKDNPQPFDLEPWTGLKPAFPEKFGKYIQEQIKNGSGFIPYSQPCFASEIEESYDWFYPECATKPGGYASGAWSHSEKRFYNAPAVCASTDFADLFIYRANKILTDFPDLQGLYYDISHGKLCYNTLHGHGGVDAFGQEYAHSTLLDLREFFLRARKVTQKHKKLLIIHGHNRFSPFTHAFGDAWYPGEQYVSMLHRNPDHFYCEDIPMREYQSAYSAQTHGCGMILFSQLRRQMWVFKNAKRLDDDVHTMMYLTPVMLHDINTGVTESKPDLIGKVWAIRHDMKLADAVFHGYWFDKTYKVNAPDVYVSWYELKNAPYRRMIVVGNVSKTDRTVKLEGIGNGKLYDLWNNNAPQNANSIKVAKESFRVFGLK